MSQRTLSSHNPQFDVCLCLEDQVGPQDHYTYWYPLDMSGEKQRAGLSRTGNFIKSLLRRKKKKKTSLCGCFVVYLLCQLLKAPVYIILIQSCVLRWKGPGRQTKHTHTNMHTKSERGYKTVYYCTHRVTGGKITGQKLRVLSARLSLLAPALQQDVFDRGTHQSHTTLSKHINTALLTDKKHSIFPRSSFSGILGGEQPFFLFFFQMDGQVSFKSSQGVWAAFRDSRGQRRDL